MTQSRALGWITRLIMFLCDRLSSTGEWIYGSRAEAQTEENTNNQEYVERRSRCVDTYVACWFFGECLLYALVVLFGSGYWLVFGAVILIIMFRTLNIVAVALRIGLFGDLLKQKGNPPKVACHERIIVLGFVNYCELILCFAVIYSTDLSKIIISDKRPLDWFDPIYLSCMTQFTIGYGDLHPDGWLRAVACVQGFLALILIVLFIGRFAALLHKVESIPEQPSIK